MKKHLLCSCLLVLSLSLFGQSEKKFDLNLSSGVVTHTISENPLKTLWPDSGETINGRYYRHIRFSTFPDHLTRAALENAGIKLLYYVSSQTYLASVAGTTTITNPSFAIEGVYKIAAKEKMHRELSYAIEATDFPAYTINANAKTGITFTYFTDIPHQLVIDQLGAYEITYQNPNSHRITAWVSQNEIESFVAQSFVCSAELVDDVPVHDNNVGRTNHRDNWMAQDFSGGRMYNGAGVNVMLQDDGVIGPHIDYTGRLIQQYLTINIGDHGDHCAGTIMGGGNKDPLTRGMGWGANLFVYRAASPYQGFDSIYNHYITNGIVITSTSYSDGCNAGYTTLAQTLDQQIYDMPNLIHVFSAGNNGTSDCSYGAGATWGNVTGGHKHSKNSIAVGNLTYLDVIANSSSRGPVHDGRMKPEVCAVGTNVYSTGEDNTYNFKTGTSMSCPAVSGTFSELYQAYKLLNGNINPPSGLMKAILMNTADDLGNAGPDFIYGYGRINGRKAIIPVEQTLYFIDAITNNGSNTHSIVVPPGTGKLKVLVYWHDYPAAVSASVALVNDLDMQVSDPASAVFNPWVLDFTPNASNLNAVATRGTDIRNNHEQVTIDNPVAGNYSVTISGTSVPMGPQEYYLVWYFEPADELVLTYPNGGEGFAPGEIETLRWDAADNSGTFNLEYTIDSGATWSVINNAIAAADRYFNWTVPAAVSGECMVRISRGAATDTSDVPFSIIPVPANLIVDWACPDSLQLSWNAVSGATEYDVFMLGNVYMDSISNTTATTCVIHNLSNTTNTYWFSVRSKGAQQAIGRRAIAIEKNPGVFCPGAFDAAVITLTSPEDYYVSCMNTSALPVTIELKNPGLTTLTSIPVSYSINGGPPVNETFAGSLPPSGITSYTFTATATIGTPGTNTIEAWAAYPNDIDGTNDTTLISVEYDVTIPVAPPMTENFETFTLCSQSSACEAINCSLINGFKNLTNGQSDDIDWRTFQGSTPSTSTGPDVDYSPGTTTGNYLYLEASTCSGRTAIMLSPCIDLGTFSNPTLTFAYHMYGSSMGQLHVDIYSNGVWTNDIFQDSGNNGNIWLTTNISLNAYTGQTVIFRFRGITGSGITSDMAIDGIQVGNISSTGEIISASSVNLYPNPGDGIFNLSVSNVNADEVIATIYDVAGRKISSVNYGEVSGTLSSQLDLSGYENGTYILELRIGDEIQILRLNKTE